MPGMIEMAPLPIWSGNFALLVLGTAGVYFLLPPRWQNYWLTVVSFLLCLVWAWQAAALLFGLTVATFVLALRMQPGTPGRGFWLAIGVGMNVAALVAFRAASYFLPQATELLTRLGWPLGAGGLQLLLPIGLAFYGLQSLAYLIEVYRRQMPATRRFGDLALYLAYFPKLVAGPLERPRAFLEQLARPRIVDNEGLARSLTLIVIGLVRKLLIADTLALAVPGHIWSVPAAVSGPELLAWLVVFSFSLYNDFAGYSSLARGVSGLFGIELTANFHAPFFARTFSEFWNRWHISLSHWLRDYVYYPLSRVLLRRFPDRHHWINLVVPPIATMAVSGMWHGLSWHMFFWGGLHGLYQVIERVFLLRRPAGRPAEWPLRRQVVGMLTVFSLVTLAWVPFQLQIPAALTFWQALFDWSSFDFKHRRLVIALAVLVPAAVLDWLQQRYQDEVAIIHLPRLVQATALAMSVLLVWIVTAEDAPLPFVYQGF